MMLDLLLRGGTVVTAAGAQRADVGIRGGRIAAVGELARADASEVFEADGLLVLPGVVDEHVHPIYLDDPRGTSIVAAHGGVTTTMGFAYGHPGESLLAAVDDLRRRSEAGSILDFTVHAGMFDAPAQVAEMAAVAETCPQYLALTSAELGRRGALAKIGPLLREPADCDALWTGLADGSLHCVGSDHVPKKSPADADLPLLDAGFGAPSIETMLPILFDGVARGRLTAERMVAVLCENPARVFGLHPRKGTIAPGSDADLVLWDPAVRRVLGMGVEHTAAGYSLYEGREVQGRPVLTIAGGRVLVRDGELVDDAPRGRFLATGPSSFLEGPRHHNCGDLLRRPYTGSPAAGAGSSSPGSGPTELAWEM
jgi:dihydropyrimidinase